MSLFYRSKAPEATGVLHKDDIKTFATKEMHVSRLYEEMKQNQLTPFLRS